MTVVSQPAHNPSLPPAVRCKGLVKRFADVVAVAGLDLEVRRGECFGLLGPNGAGKTTTIEILEGLTPADAGEVEVLGERWGQGRDRALRGRLGIQLQETQLNDKLSVEETVRLFRSFAERGRTVDAVLALVELDAKRRSWVGKLSGGQKQRLALACTMLHSPEVVFLDEPTAGVDPAARRLFWTIIRERAAEGVTMIVTTHYMDEAERFDQLVFLSRGHVVAQGSPAQVKHQFGGTESLEDVFVHLQERDE